MSGDCILTVDHLSMRFGGIVAVNDLSFAAERRRVENLLTPTRAAPLIRFHGAPPWTSRTRALRAPPLDGAARRDV